MQNPTIGYQCGICSDSDACGGGFTLFWISSSDHALLLRDESDDMFWSMLDKKYLTQEELRLALLRWWPTLEDRDEVDLGEIEMVDERLVTPSALLSYPETRVIYLPYEDGDGCDSSLLGAHRALHPNFLASASLRSIVRPAFFPRAIEQIPRIPVALKHWFHPLRECRPAAPCGY